MVCVDRDDDNEDDGKAAADKPLLFLFLVCWLVLQEVSTILSHRECEERESQLYESKKRVNWKEWKAAMINIPLPHYHLHYQQIHHHLGQQNHPEVYNKK